MARGELAGGTDECDGGPGSMIALPSGTQIWIAAGVTDMRKGFDTLCALVQETLVGDVARGY